MKEQLINYLVASQMFLALFMLALMLINYYGRKRLRMFINYFEVEDFPFGFKKARLVALLNFHKLIIKTIILTIFIVSI